MDDIERKRQQGKKRAQNLRNRRKEMGLTTFPVEVAEIELAKLKEICEFFGYPSEPYSQDEAITAMIHRIHAEIPKIEEKLGCCGKCGEQLPQGCAKYAKGGLFKGDATCWHTLNRVRIFEANKECSS